MRSNRRPAGLADDLVINPMFTQDSPAEAGAPRPLPEPRDAARYGLPADPRRAPARRQLAPERGDVRHDLDGAAGPGADGRDARQEHDRQGRVPADGRARDALRADARRSLACPERRRPGGLDGRLVRGLHARWPGAQAALAGAPAGCRPARRPAEHGRRGERPGRLGQVLQLLRGRAAARAARRRSPPHRAGRGGRPVRREHDRRGRHPGLDDGRRATSRSPRLADALDALQARTGIDVPIHVDGASGAMVAPFLEPDLAWDFRLPRVASISTSGHKYGLVYPGRRLGDLARPGGPARGPRSSTSTTWAATWARSP